MESGKIVLASLPQSDGKTKLRPALVLKLMPPYNDLLVCGISTQLQQEIKDFDDIIRAEDDDFPASGLIQESLVRLAYLAVIPRSIVRGSIGNISDTRLQSLKQRLAEFILRK